MDVSVCVTALVLGRICPQPWEIITVCAPRWDGGKMMEEIECTKGKNETQIFYVVEIDRRKRILTLVCFLAIKYQQWNIKSFTARSVCLLTGYQLHWVLYK